MCAAVIDHVLAAGGDSFLQICLWRQGFAVTDPGPGLTMPDVQMFDPGTEESQGPHAAVDQRCGGRLQRGLSGSGEAVF